MKILVGISGGVDSACAVRLLMDGGHTVEAAVLVMHDYTELDAAREVAASLGVRLHEIDCRERFDRLIRSDFVAEYTAGRTPNPCIICNALVKFRILADTCRQLGFDAIATGHYARVVRIGDRYAVGCADDLKKDQSYMLYRLPQDVLSILMLPLAELTKPEIREYAASVGIPVAEKADSLEICFLPDGDYAAYVESVAGKSPEGDFIDENGKSLGRHKGIVRYTVGQRKGLGISLGARAFVTAIDPVKNTVTLSQNPTFYDKIYVTDAVFSGIGELDVGSRIDALVKVRYTAPAVPVTAVYLGDGRAELSFCSPVKAAPGQSAVVYRDGAVLFGGFIRSYL